MVVKEIKIRSVIVRIVIKLLSLSIVTTKTKVNNHTNLITNDIILDKDIILNFAETCGNRTHLPVFHQNNGFEDRGAHQEHNRFHN